MLHICWRPELGTLLRCVFARRALALALAGGLLGPVAADAQRPAARPASVSVPQAVPSLVFDGVTVVDVEQGRLVAGQRVVIGGNRILAVEAISKPSVVPPGTPVVDARGKYLIPGLWDMHVHLDGVPSGRMRASYELFIANGVTGFRDAFTNGPLDSVVVWRREILAGSRVGPPRQLLSGAAIDASPSCGRRSKNGGHVCVSTNDSSDARFLVDSMKQAGADMIKTYNLTAPMYFVLAAEARRKGMLIGGHPLQDGPGSMAASDSGARIFDHVHAFAKGDLTDRCWARRATASVAACKPMAERFRRNGTFLAPTLLPFWDGTGAGGMSLRLRFSSQIAEYVERPFKSFWNDGMMAPGNWLRDSANATLYTVPAGPDTLRGLSIIQQVNLPILAGTDINSEQGGWGNGMVGFALHVELAMLVSEGVTPLTALQAATLNPAKMLRATDSMGTVAAGKLADLVLLDANPLADITNTTMIRAVVANGRYFDRPALDRLLKEVPEMTLLP